MFVLIMLLHLIEHFTNFVQLWLLSVRIDGVEVKINDFPQIPLPIWLSLKEGLVNLSFHDSVKVAFICILAKILMLQNWDPGYILY